MNAPRARIDHNFNSALAIEHCAHLFEAQNKEERDEIVSYKAINAW